MKKLFSLFLAALLIVTGAGAQQIETRRGVLVQSYDKDCVNHGPDELPIDYETRTNLYALDELSPDVVFIIPDEDFFLPGLVLPGRSVSVQDSVRTLLRDVRYTDSVDSCRLEKRREIEMDVLRIDPAQVKDWRYQMLLSDYYIGQNREKARLYVVAGIRRRTPGRRWTVTVTGTVTDKQDSTSVIGCAIYRNEDPEFSNAVSGIDGNYSLRVPAAEISTIHFDCLGYYSVPAVVFDPLTDNPVIDVQLDWDKTPLFYQPIYYDHGNRQDHPAPLARERR